MIRKGGMIRIGDIVELGVFLSVRIPFLLLSFAFPYCIEHFFIHNHFFCLHPQLFFILLLLQHPSLFERVITVNITQFLTSIKKILDINICQDL